MTLNTITNRHSYNKGYISLPGIQLKNIPETIEVNGLTLHRKSEFHISLVSVKQLDDITAIDNVENMKKTLVSSFISFERSNNLTEFQLNGKYRLVKRGDRMTVVAMVDMDNIEKLFDTLREDTGIDISTQPTHITLFTLQPEMGIGLASQEQVLNESVEIVIPALSGIAVVQSSKRIR